MTIVMKVILEKKFSKQLNMFTGKQMEQILKFTGLMQV